MPEFHAPKVHDLGGFTVERVLPNARRRSVGPFVFFDHIGPALLEGPQPVAVRPHPHIGLATVTYLWEGAMMHRDSLGSVQEINPGDVNWMTAGRGIVHSERTPERLRGVPHRFHGLQTWIALPQAHEVLEPGSTPMLQARSAARVMLLGGEPLDAPRFVWWNFVSSSRERIERAKRDWTGGRFDSVPGETEFIPLPEEK